MHKVILTLKMDMDLNGEEPRTIEKCLRDAVNYLMGNGMITDGTEAEIDSWDTKVECLAPLDAGEGDGRD